MRYLILIFVFLVCLGCKSQRKSSQIETSEQSKTEQVISKTDSSSIKTQRTYEEALQLWAYRGTSILFDSLSTVTIQPSGIISATGYGARINHSDSSKTSRQIISAEQVSKDTVARVYESKSQEIERAGSQKDEAITKGFKWWILMVIGAILGLGYVTWRALRFYLKPF